MGGAGREQKQRIVRRSADGELKQRFDHVCARMPKKRKKRAQRKKSRTEKEVKRNEERKKEVRSCK